MTSNLSFFFHAVLCVWPCQWYLQTLQDSQVGIIHLRQIVPESSVTASRKEFCLSSFQIIILKEKETMISFSVSPNCLSDHICNSLMFHWGQKINHMSCIHKVASKENVTIELKYLFSLLCYTFWPWQWYLQSLHSVYVCAWW